jgi:hypothetical protein
MEAWMLRYGLAAVSLLLLLSLGVVVAVYAVQPASAASGGPDYVCERCSLLAYRTICQGCRANAARPHRIYEIYRCCDYCYGGGCQIVQISKCISYC